MAKNVGWIKLFRKLIDNRMYFEEPFDKTHAWIDLIMSADRTGKLDTSIVQLADRWKWSQNKVRRYFAKLEADGMVRTVGSHGGASNGTTVFVVKYEEYQHGWRTDESSDERTDESSEWGKGDLYNIYITRREEEKNTPSTLKSTTPKVVEAKTDYSTEFDEVWKLYPNKKGKPNALKDYSKARAEGVSRQTIEDGIRNYIAECKRLGTQAQYIAHGSTWFHQRRWEDDYTSSEPYAKTAEAVTKKAVGLAEDEIDIAKLLKGE